MANESSNNESTNDGGQDEGDRSALWRAVSRTSKSRGIRGKIADLYGKTSRGTPDTKAAAQELGVSQRTVQRWIKERRTPKSEGGARLATGHDQWRDSPEGRRAQLGPGREQRLRSTPTKVKYTGRVTISSDTRMRSTSVELTGQQMGAILDAQLAGDDKTAHIELEKAFGDVFGGSVGLSPHGFQL